MESTIEGAAQVHRVKRGPKPKVAAIEAPADESLAQAYAMRVWDGQSVDVPRAERIERCVSALRGQNLPNENIVYPT